MASHFNTLVEISDVVVTNGRSMASAFQFVGVPNVRMKHCYFNFSTGVGIRSSPGIDWMPAYIMVGGVRRASNTMSYTLHCASCKFWRSAAALSFNSDSPATALACPFILLEGDPYSSTRPKIQTATFSDIVVRDSTNGKVTAPVIEAMHFEIGIDGDTKIR